MQAYAAGNSTKIDEGTKPLCPKCNLNITSVVYQHAQLQEAWPPPRTVGVGLQLQITTTTTAITITTTTTTTITTTTATTTTREPEGQILMPSFALRKLYSIFLIRRNEHENADVKFLSDYIVDIRYHSRKANVVADALSRKEWEPPLEFEL
ncbi:hypothetical protein Tco_0222519 [Tanacetum coccineum]